MMELVYCECLACGFDAVLPSRPEPYWCPLCASDSGHDVMMKQLRPPTDDDKVEGRDERK